MSSNKKPRRCTDADRLGGGPQNESEKTEDEDAYRRLASAQWASVSFQLK